MLVEIPHGGSGSGWSKWSAWSSACLIACDLADRHPQKCTNANLLIGTMVHEYLRLWRTDQIEVVSGEPAPRVEFVDSVCGHPPQDEWQDEAYRLWSWYADNREKDHWGRTLHVELLLRGEKLESAMGVSPYSAQLDLVAEQDGVVRLVDYKTSSQSGDSRYIKGHGRIQMHSYWVALKACTGICADEIWIEQIVKTKTPKINEYQIPVPTWIEQEEIRRGLADTAARREYGLRTRYMAHCDSCVWRSDGLCL